MRLNLHSPHAAKQWKVIFDRGSVVAPPLAITTGAIFAYLANLGMTYIPIP